MRKLLAAVIAALSVAAARADAPPHAPAAEKDPPAQPEVKQPGAKHAGTPAAQPGADAGEPKAAAQSGNEPTPSKTDPKAGAGKKEPSAQQVPCEPVKPCAID
jgi:hypothetical protein